MLPETTANGKTKRIKASYEQICSLLNNLN